MDWDSNWEHDAIVNMDKGGETPCDWIYEDLGIIYDSSEEVTNGRFIVLGCGYYEDNQNGQLSKHIRRLKDQLARDMVDDFQSMRVDDIRAIRKSEKSTVFNLIELLPNHFYQRPYIMFCLDLIGATDTVEYRLVAALDNLAIMFRHGDKYAIIMEVAEE